MVMAGAAAIAFSTLGVIGAGPDARASAQPIRTAAVRSPQLGAVPGTQLWASHFKGSALSVVASPDGSKVFVVGIGRWGGTGDDFATLAYNAATGAQLWRKRYDGPAHGWDDLTSVAVSPDGRTVFVTGASQGTTGYDYATLAYNASTGARLWLKRYNRGGNRDDFGYSVTASPDGSKVYVTGLSQGISSGQDYTTVAYTAATGTQLWAQTYNGPGNGDDVSYSTVASPDGSRVFVTGFSHGSSSGEDYATLAYDAATGTHLWTQRYNGPGNGTDDPGSVAASPDGNTVFVTGVSQGISSGADFATIAYDAATGTQLWARRYNGPSNSADTAFSVAASPDRTRVFVTGWSDAASSMWDYATVAYNAATGTQQWAQTYNGPGNATDTAHSVALSPDGGTVYVTGTSDGGSTSRDFATIAYDAATGTQQWAQRYNRYRHGAEGAGSVTVSTTTGTVFVTGGGQWGSSTTIAYSG